jgi:hypothetical protein
LPAGAQITLSPVQVASLAFITTVKLNLKSFLLLKDFFKKPPIKKTGYIFNKNLKY